MNSTKTLPVYESSLHLDYLCRKLILIPLKNSSKTCKVRKCLLHVLGERILKEFPMPGILIGANNDIQNGLKYSNCTVWSRSPHDKNIITVKVERFQLLFLQFSCVQRGHLPITIARAPGSYTPVRPTSHFRIHVFWKIRIAGNGLG